MRIAIISYEGPGDMWVGAVRLRGLIKELQLRGDDVLLITSEVNSRKSELIKGINHVIIESPPLLKMTSYAREFLGVKCSPSKARKIFAQSRINHFLGMIRSCFGDIEREIFIPDSRILWRNSASFYIRKLMRKFHPDVIVSIGNPVSHMVAYDIKTDIAKKVLWIAELQDPWPNHVCAPMNPITCHLAKRREMSIMALPDILVCATEGIAQLYPHPSKVVIPFGSELEPMDIPNMVEPFTIGYYGNLYKDRYLSASLFIFALAKLKQSDPGLGHKIKFRIFSRNFSKKIDDLISHLGLESNVIFENVIERNQVFMSMARNHILVSFQGDRYNYAVASKIYDYIMTGRPILSVTSPDSCEARFIERFAGTRAADNIETIANALITFLKMPASYSYRSSRPKATYYTQRVIACQFADLIYQASAMKER